MKESIAYTTRLCTACGRPGYHTRKEIAPNYQPLCGTCIAWSNMLKDIAEVFDMPLLGHTAQFSMLWPHVRALVRGAEREGCAHALMMRKLGEISQFAAPFAPPLTTTRT